MKRVRLQQSDNLAVETINPTKKRRVQRARIRNKYKINTNNGYHSEETKSDNECIELIDNYIKSIESLENTQFKECINTIDKDYETKTSEISSQFEQTKISINNKYEYEAEIIKNQYIELIDRAKEKLTVKYNEKKTKQERLFKSQFEQHLQKQLEHKPMPNDKSPIFEKDIYQRRKLIESKHQTDSKMEEINDNNQFFDPILQEKWSKMGLIAEDDLAMDVHDIINKPRECRLKIQDIFSKFPRYHVIYKSDENILEIGSTDNDLDVHNSFILKAESPIVIQYTGQCLMTGKVVSISRKEFWCNVRKKGDKFAEYSLCCIKKQDIEQEKVKVKLVNGQ